MRSWRRGWAGNNQLAQAAGRVSGRLVRGAVAASLKKGRKPRKWGWAGMVVGLEASVFCILPLPPSPPLSHRAPFVALGNQNLIRSPWLDDLYHLEWNNYDIPTGIWCMID